MLVAKNDNKVYKPIIMIEDCDVKTDQLWENLNEFLAEIPRPVKLVVWANPQGRWEEREAIRLVQTLADEFEQLSSEQREPKPNYSFYPVIAVMGMEDREEVDFGVRIIGLPAGVQITSLVGGIQAVTFRGQQLEPVTRIKLAKMPASADIELITDTNDQPGTVMASRCFNFAVANKHVRTFLILADTFPTALYRHNVERVPHMVINNNIHVEGVLDEGGILKHLAKAVKKMAN